MSGDEAHLVVRYEYTPGFDELDALATGGQGHYWVNDYVKVGLTASTSEEGDDGQQPQRRGRDVAHERGFLAQGAGGDSEGLVSSSMYSDDGGFGFVSETRRASMQQAPMHIAPI